MPASTQQENRMFGNKLRDRRIETLQEEMTGVIKVLENKIETDSLQTDMLEDLKKEIAIIKRNYNAQ